MAQNYKGIELEIGGNTTGLKKALNDIDKQLNSTQKELNAVNHLLKFDPTNTELLAQKQKLLSNQFDDTQKRVESLRDAKEKADKAMADGTEVNEKQYRALQREIIETEKKLGDLTKDAEDFNQAFKKLNKSGPLKKITSAFDKLKDKISNTKTHLSESFSNTKVGKLFTPISNGVKKVGSKISSLGSIAVKTGKSIEDGMAAAAKGMVAAAKVIATGIAATGAALFAAAGSTREYREDMNRLNTAFKNTGKTTETAQKTYSSFYAVLGESDRSVEAVNHLAQLCKSEEELAKWGDICAGVSATFGDSLPIEGLTEAANETAKVGQVTGPLADALNWIGISEDEFNEKLKKCNTEQERSTLITETLNNAYQGAADSFKEMNADVMAAREAQAQLDSSMALLGKTAEGIVSPLKAIAAEGLSSIATGLSQIFSGDNKAGLETITAGVNQFVEKAIEQVNRLMTIAEPILTALADAIIKNLPMLIDAAVKIVTMLGKFVENNADKICDTSVTVIIQLASALIAALPKLIPAAVKIIGTLIKTIADHLPDLLKLGAELGKNLIKGLGNGIIAAGKELWKIATGVANSIKKIFTGKDGFDIHSPSKWAEKIGKFLMEGLAEGINNDMSAEEVLQKKIGNLKSFISNELGVSDSDIKLADAEYELWELQNPNATDNKKTDRQIGLLMSKIKAQSSAVQIVNDALYESVQLTGENSTESKEYQLQLINERIELEKLEEKMRKVMEARRNLYQTSSDTAAPFKLTNFTNPVHYMRQNNTARQAGQKEGQTVNNVTQNYYGYKGTISENNAALKKTLRNAEVSLA